MMVQQSLATAQQRKRRMILTRLVCQDQMMKVQCFVTIESMVGA